MSGSLPTHWSPTQNVQWVTTIPGQGYSSPVISGENVYVTTAYLTDKGSLWRSSVEYLLFGLALVAALAGLRYTVQTSRKASVGRDNARSLARLWMYAVTLTTIVLLLFLGAKLFNVERCDIRSWLYSSVMASLCLLLGGYDLRPGSRWHGIVGMSSLLFAGFLLFAIPSKDHALRGGLLSPNRNIVFVVVALPLAIGIFHLCALGWGSLSREQQQTSLAGRKAQQLGWMAAGSTLLLALLGAIGSGVFSHKPLLSPGLNVPMELPLLLSWRPVVLSLSAVALSLWVRKFLPIEGSANTLLIVSGVYCALTFGIKSFELVARYCPYLVYHFDQPKIEPMLGMRAMWLFAALCLVGGTIQQLRPGSREVKSGIPRLFRVSVLMLGGIGFLNANYMSRTKEFVRAILCLQRTTGSLQWVCESLPGEQGLLDRHNTPATPTPVTDGERIYGYFGTAGLMCADRQGNLVWTNRNLPFESAYGAATSPTLHEGVLVLVSDVNRGKSQIWALDCRSGDMLWSQQWAANSRMESGNNRTPEIKSMHGRATILVWCLDCLRAFDLHTGASLWNLPQRFSMADAVAGSVSDPECLYLSTGGETRALRLASLGQSGQHPLWTTLETSANCASPVVSKDMLFVIEDQGLAVCLDTHSGKTLWQQNLEGQYFASPVANGKYVYFANSEGVTTVVACERKFRKIAENDLGEPTFASFAGSGGNLFIRTATHLYSLGSK